MVGKSKRVEPMLVTAPPLGASTNASPMDWKSIAFEVQSIAYRLVSRFPLVRTLASLLVRLSSPHDITVR